MKQKGESKPNIRQRTGLLCLKGILIALLVTLPVRGVQADWPSMVPSGDGTLISYEIYGSGDPTLVFVHGWSCDARYFREQIPYFSRDHRIILMDLAGHGHSGSHRARYTMKAFGEDVKAVVEAENLDKIILIGHSMGGNVIAEATLLLPDKVLGLIGIDTLENVEFRMSQEDRKNMLVPFKEDFIATTRKFTEDMILPGTDPELAEWIISDMSATQPEVAISAMEEMLQKYVTGEAATIFQEISLPIVTVNAGLWPVNFEGNRKYMHSYEAIVLESTDHFLMLDEPERCNPALEKAIGLIMKQTAF